MSLTKVPFLAASAVGVYVAHTPPQPKVPPTARPKTVTSYERVFSSLIRFYTGSFKVCLYSAWGSLETCVILASRFPTHPLSQMILDALVPHPLYNTGRIGFSPIFLVGCSIATLGGFIRYKCYRELGRLFTYEVTIQQNHQLVTTGPYAYVRHPGYTSVIASCVGMGVCLASPGSWLKECGVFDTFAGKIAVWLYVGYTVWGAVSAVARTSLEDRLMKEQFGEDWNKWAQNVPYRLIPYVF
ncbi:hypothetical protein IEO21_09600 [Rhodonia placenta]|uniref:Protein-S-isoprenylcysteine O-methyltransferase n=1 Tax=Rhodonia placenta TaxID=104341 RepID=A0A8H7NU26_9APHY|nr:hypothetical protein IEO21_09600 [Postia placenta]